MVAVAIGGRGVDANLRILLVIGSPESKFFTWFSLPLAPTSRPCVPKASNRIGLGFLQGKRLKILASTLFVAKFISWDIDGQIPCRLLPDLARSREADLDQVRYRFNGLGRGIPSQLISDKKFLEWLIEEIGVVEEMIRRKVPSV
ncbi:hypothetical protein Taro_047242 [Colocasia esculenta]|uniref:Uncharacterized protein n=1 Tax=Colocasia esculenta TaxID=4460 RepID=A0A843X7U8_COLES|nr:hypothetical protein [Colocasia esculenta]